MRETIDLRDIQGGILHGYSLGHAGHLLLRARSPESARSFLRARLTEGVTDGRARQRARAEGRSLETALNVGVTYAGLALLGLPERLLQGLPPAFSDRARNRARALGDLGGSDPDGWEDHVGTGEVHLLVSVHAESGVRLSERLEDLQASFDREGVEPLARQETHALEGKIEHFGFADGGSQPAVEGVPGHEASVSGGGVPLTGGRWRPVKLGEFVLGYQDEDGQADLRPSADLVRNGSYLVYRKLEQDVSAFRATLAEAAEESGLDVELVAAKVVGRWRDGRPLELDPRRTVSTDLEDTAEADPPNDFRYLPHDREGFVCPRGAHIRRANPRDSFEFEDKVAETGLLTARHRILRRGMPYGPALPPGEAGDGQERGLLFLCYNADLERQFETIQRAWCCDGDAFFLGDDQDFLLGNERGSGKMTIPVRDAPPRFLETRPDLVVTRGMEYFLMPGLRALRLLASAAPS